MIADIERKIDKIIVTEKEFKKIAKWGKENLVRYIPDGIKPQDKKMFFPLKTFILDLSLEKGTKIKALVELDTFNPVNGGRVTTDKYWYTYKRDFMKRGYEFKGEGAPKNIINTSHAFILETLIYICQADREKEYRQRIERAKATGRTNPYEYQDRVCFLLNDIVEYAGTHKTKKSIQYQCECWGVRGHLRHYQNGRVVFIEPFKKGSKRDILEPRSKTYMIWKEAET